MRSERLHCLLVDHYDSFTYNLVRYLEICGCQVCVITHDDAEFDLQVHDWDLIVLSPGPGHPAKDCGRISTEVLDIWFGHEKTTDRDQSRAVELPLLFGVCLGHQAIALRCGWSVDLSLDGPRHGKVEWIRVSKDSALFGPEIVEEPSDDCMRLLTCERPTHVTSDVEYWMPVTRYHSLAAVGPGNFLRATAWSSEAVVMALEGPGVLGVQFHPESVGTGAGMEIIRRVVGMVKRQPLEEVKVPQEDFRVSNPLSFSGISPPNCHPLPLNQHPLPFLYESLFHEPKRAGVWIDGPEWVLMAGGRRERGLPAQFGTWGSPGIFFPPFCTPMIIGFITYEEQNEFLEFSNIFIIHRESNQSWALGSSSWAAQLESEILGLTGQPKISTQSYSSLCHPGMSVRIVTGATEYKAKVSKCKEFLKRGDSYELCLTTQMVLGCSLPPLSKLSFSGMQLFLAQREISPSNYSSLFEYYPSGTLICGSPEKFLEISSSDEALLLQSHPIKGTRPRGVSAEDDIDKMNDLKTSEKDISENLMIVDLVRNDLSRVCHDIVVDSLCEVVTLPLCHQMVSKARGLAPVSVSFEQAVSALFPPGSMTGAPKKKSMEILSFLENRTRGVYSGAAGWVSPNACRADLAVVIRSLWIPEKDNFTISAGAGGAVTIDSDPQTEWEEVLVKLRSSFKCLTRIFGELRLRIDEGIEVIGKKFPGPDSCLIESMRVDDNGKIWLLGAHLERMKKSAFEFWGHVVELEELRMEICYKLAEIDLTKVIKLPLEEAEFDIQNHFKAVLEGDTTFSSHCVKLRVIMNHDKKIHVDVEKLGKVPKEVRIARIGRFSVSWGVCWKFLLEKPHISTTTPSVLWNEFGELTEGDWFNIAFEKFPGHFITPYVNSGLLPGTLRAELLNHGLIQEGRLEAFPKENWFGKQVFCFNSVRGVWKAVVVA